MLSLSTIQFDLLVWIERYQSQHPAIDQIAEKTHYPLTDTQHTIATLLSLHLLDENLQLTPQAYTVLAPFRVKRAIFMAAGFGSRMVPLTLSMPKPLIKVKGQRMIETLLDAVIAAGIEDIVIVRGYQAEAFELLKPKYPMIRFIDNPTYQEANNIGSAMKFKDLMANAYVLESDLVLSNPDIIRKYEQHSNYLGKAVHYTNDWCFDVQDGIIQAVHSDGGYDVYHMYGISYWQEADALRMAEDIPALYQQEGGKQKYFDEVSLRDFQDHYQIHVRPVYEGEIVEIDSFQELQEIDEAYRI